jgi:hypothetical protein
MIKPIFFIFALLVLFCFAQDCNSNGVKNYNFCSCFSGYSGTSCEMKAQPPCTWHNLTNLGTDFYPTMETNSLQFQNDILKFSILSKIVNNRLDTKIYIQQNYTDQSEICGYPGNFSSNTLDLTGLCYNRFNYSIPWNLGKNCYWTIFKTLDEDIYSGVIYIEQKENLGSIRGIPIQRFLKSAIPMSIKFKKRITLSSNIQVSSPIDMISAITRLEYVRGPPQSGIIEFITSLAYPFVLNASSVTNVLISTAGLSGTLVDISDPSLCLPGSPCTQKFRILVSVTSACSFTGLYKMKFNFACQPGSQCPITYENATITLDVNSENFCTVTNVNIGLNGVMNSYSDSLFQIKSNNFILGKTAYFKSVLSANAALQSSNLERVQVINGNSTKVAYDNGITSDGQIMGFQYTGNYSNSVTFHLNSFEVPADSNAQITVEATIRVTYVNAQNDYKFDFIQSKFVMDESDGVGSQNTKVSKSIEISKAVNGASSFCFCFLLIFLIFLF